MDWKRLLTYITGTVDQELLLRNKYLVTENRILRDQIQGRVRRRDGERKALAEIGQQMGKHALEAVATIVTPDAMLAWHALLHDTSEAHMAVSPSTRRVVRERARRRCEYCHANERWQCIRCTIDHVVPQSAGGSDDAENLALVCRNRNERRGNRLEGRDPETQTFVPLFNARRERWSEHFVWDQACLRIIG